MKKIKLLFVAFCIGGCTTIMAQWKPAGERIKTEWAEKLDPNNVLQEYPRPQMQRESWKNLNGFWEYAIVPKNTQPTSYQGQILVPFAIESALSGVQKNLGSKNELFYKRHFTIPSKWSGKNIRLNFGAVDWRADVYLNGIYIGKHEGGYTPFSFDITPYLKKNENELVVKVFDPTNEGYQGTGKQVTVPQGIWYTPVSGIWQTVWIEPVSDKHITNIKAVSDIDNGYVEIRVETNEEVDGFVEAKIMEKSGKLVGMGRSKPGLPMRVYIENPKLWTPDSPHLYDMELSVYDSGKEVDKVDSYTAMRKISMKRDGQGITRIQLNNKFMFHLGTLDQGWWPDGLYTAPSDEALKYDIEKTKAWGFNMIRKHVKVEPARWYYHCDKLGMLVWQDIPNGDTFNNMKTLSHPNAWSMTQYGTGTDVNRSEKSKRAFYQETKEIMDFVYSNPSVVMICIFNEHWGQFETEKVTKWCMEYDPSRLISPASGGNHRECGHVLDLHHYPHPRMMMKDYRVVNVLGEYGGIGMAQEGHLWDSDRNWGYIRLKSAKEVTDVYEKYGKELIKLVKDGFGGAVYTQTTDVEAEVNGLMTYDRKVIKIDESRVRKINEEIIRSMDK